MFQFVDSHGHEHKAHNEQQRKLLLRLGMTEQKAPEQESPVPAPEPFVKSWQTEQDNVPLTKSGKADRRTKAGRDDSESGAGVADTR